MVHAGCIRRICLALLVALSAAGVAHAQTWPS